jgi:transitional endoplasmic reticulum ATPase
LRQLIEAVEWPLKHADYFARVGVRPPKGILLSGLPGCGKTLLAKAVASETEVNFISVKGPSLLSKYVGESVRGVREVFKKAMQAAPCIIFFDEIDALIPTRGSGGTDAHVTERVNGQLLAELDGVEELNGVLVLGATNRPDILDPALLRPGRFAPHVQIPLPDWEGRQEIFRIGLRDKPLTGDVDLDEWQTRPRDSPGPRSRPFAKQAALVAIREALAQPAETTPPIVITRTHLARALDDVTMQHLSPHL